MLSQELVSRAKFLLELLRKAGFKITTAESCTGGLVAALFTEIPGSSDVFERGFITYSNEAKHELLGVSQQTLDKYGAVSQETAEAMASGALNASRADIALSITGVAGPGGGSAEKPVGLVHFGSFSRHKGTVHRKHLFGDLGRHIIRKKSCEVAFDLLSLHLDN